MENRIFVVLYWNPDHPLADIPKAYAICAKESGEAEHQFEEKFPEKVIAWIEDTADIDEAYSRYWNNGLNEI